MDNRDARMGSPRANANASNTDEALLQSLKQLNLSTSPSSNASAPRPPTRGASRSPRLPPSRLSSTDGQPLASPSSRNAPRSPILRSVSSGNFPSSQSGGQGLLRKASMNSLHSNSGVAPGRSLSRRSSAANLLSPTTSKSNLHAEEPPKPKLTPASVAEAYLKSELDLLHGATSEIGSDTIVIFHDSCYGHRFARTKTTKGNLLTIVERPERIQACAVGVALAYIRLGDRHSEGKNPIHPKLNPASLGTIPFKILKSQRRLPLTSPAVTNVHGTKWMDDLKIMCSKANDNLMLGLNELARPQPEQGSDARSYPLHVGDLYLCGESLAAFEGALGAVCEAVDVVFSPSPVKRAFVAVRPPGHHCSASQPQGFCWLNNVHVGIMHGFLNHGLTHAAIIDFDLHHGDGSQAIAWAHNQKSHKQPKNAAGWKKTSIGYFSLHDINSYPCEMGEEDNVKAASLCIENAHGQTIWNVHLQEWSSEVEFWTLYQTTYSVLLDKARLYLKRQAENLRAAGQEPKAAIFFSAGFDASEWEGTGMQRHEVNVPTQFYARLTRDVVKLASEEGLAVEGRVISALEGGYSDRALASGVFSHLSGLAGNGPIPAANEDSTCLNRDMGRRISTSGRRRSTLSGDDGTKSRAVPGFPYDPAWWSGPELDRLDVTMAPPSAEPRPPRTNAPPTYSSPTQASSARIVAPVKVRRGSGMGINGSQSAPSRPPSPPPPEVPWTSAVHELSKLLIPTDRPVSSVTWDELKADASRAKKERQSMPAQQASMVESDLAAATARMSLRERKPARGPSPDVMEEISSSRRRTVGVVPKTPSKSARPPSRRLSGASVAMTGLDEVSELPSFDQMIRDTPSRALGAPPADPGVAAHSGVTRPAGPARKDSSKATPKPRKTTKMVVPRVEAGKTSAGSSAAPSPRRASRQSSPVRRQGAEKASGRASREPSLAPSVAPSDSGSDIGKVTNGVRKIKLVTKEMKEARQRAEVDRLTPSSEFRVQTPTMLEVPSAPTSSVSETAPDLPSMAPPNSGRGRGPAPEEIKLPSSLPQTPTILTPGATSPLESGAGQQSESGAAFLQYQPPGPAPSAIAHSGPLQWLPTNVADTPQVLKQQRGHNFTSTGAIPFAVRPAGHEAQAGRADNEEPTGRVSGAVAKFENPDQAS